MMQHYQNKAIVRQPQHQNSRAVGGLQIVLGSDGTWVVCRQIVDGIELTLEPVRDLGGFASEQAAEQAARGYVDRQQAALTLFSDK